jgi:hypothetical protein
MESQPEGARMMRPFKLGRLVATPGALVAMEECGVDATTLLARHAANDWGDVDAHDKRANDRAIFDETRILSAYDVGGARFWIITEADRSVTTILLPEEY